MIEAAFWDCTNAEYHADNGKVGRSMLEVFRSSRRRFQGRFVTKTIPAPESSAALRQGEAFHVRLLEPHVYQERIAIGPDVDRRTKKGREAWADFEAGALGRTIINATEAADIEAWREAAMRNHLVKTLVESDGRTEQAIVWPDCDGRLVCKIRTDKLIGRVVLDLKTALRADPGGFIKSAVNYGYHRQDAMYTDGVRLLLREEPAFLFVVLAKTPPHEVAVYELDSDARTLGRSQYRRALVELAECYRTSEWASPWELEPQKLSLPAWAGNEAAWEIA